MNITLREITIENFHECINLVVIMDSFIYNRNEGTE